jgi:hypothetical protein
MKEKIYISGQITGLPFDEVKARFDSAEEILRAQNYETVSPLKTGIPYSAPWEIHVVMDIVLLIGCDAIFLLKNWKYSKGATLEKNIAELIGKKVIYEEIPVFVELKQAISEVMEISFYDITGNSHSRNFVYARMIYAHFCRKQGAKITRIAAEMNHDHSTIIYYLRKFNDDNRYNPEFRQIVSRIEETLSKTNFLK